MRKHVFIKTGILENYNILRRTPENRVMSSACEIWC